MDGPEICGAAVSVWFVGASFDGGVLVVAGDGCSERRALLACCGGR